ncbi:MAG: hypothetical protein CSA68_02490 [Rhodobacterales bacterium]|nr:MAG: hypothetical protein CSA68_02490 [Rhodobacterales bacterium]
MYSVRKLTLPLLLVAFGTASAVRADALTPLSKENHINYSLMAAVAGDVIRKTCPSISARMFVVLGKAYALKSYARKKGYTEAEVRAFLKDPAEKARVKGLAANYLKNRGAVPGDVASYCQVGRAEIAKKTLVGQLLRAR